jgi:hypothetical protein
MLEYILCTHDSTRLRHRPLIPGKSLTLTQDNTNEVFFDVSFRIDGNGAVCMTTAHPLTYTSDLQTLSASAGDEVTFPLDHEVYLCTTSVLYPVTRVSVVKKGVPRDPTPPPENTDRLPSTLTHTPEPQAPQQTRPKRQKRPKRPKRFEFHMC